MASEKRQLRLAITLILFLVHEAIAVASSFLQSIEVEHALDAVALVLAQQTHLFETGIIGIVFFGYCPKIEYHTLGINMPDAVLVANPLAWQNFAIHRDEHLARKWYAGPCGANGFDLVFSEQ